MLHIENIDEHSIKFGNGYGGGTHYKVLSKTMVARKDEKDLIWIWHTQNNEALLNAASVDEITLDGTVYATAELFVVAFNAVMASDVAFVTTTTTTVTP